MEVEKGALFCPILMASDALEPRWTLAILTELLSGSSRFNDIRRGIPGISPSLLSKRLKQMEDKDLIKRIVDTATGAIDYVRTDAAVELEPILNALGEWAYRHTTEDQQLCWVDPKVFMWNLGRKVDGGNMPSRQIVLQFTYPEQTPEDYWVIVRPNTANEICFLDPGYDVDLFIRTSLRSIAAVFFGRAKLSEELQADRIKLHGAKVLETSIHRWLNLSSYANLDS